MDGFQKRLGLASSKYLRTSRYCKNSLEIRGRKRRPSLYLSHVVNMTYGCADVIVIPVYHMQEINLPSRISRKRKSFTG